jgi:hypothetical protein
MKKLSLILIASLALVMAGDFNAAYAGDHDGDGGGGIPLSKLAGKWASASQGSITICFKRDFSASENCSTVGAVPVTFNDPSVTAFTQDKAGNACGTGTDVGSVPGDSHPPEVTVSHGVNKVISYDPATGSGDVSIGNYSGGKCIGSTFDSAGAKLLMRHGTLRGLRQRRARGLCCDNLNRSGLRLRRVQLYRLQS